MSVTCEIRDGLAVVTMDDGKANVASTSFLGRLDAAFDRAEADARAVVLCGRDNVFSAGYDLGVMMGGDPDALREMLETGEAVLRRFLTLPIPTVAVAAGHAIALGALFFLAADSRITEDGPHRFHLNETANGLPLPDYGVEIASARLAPPAAFAMAVQSEPFDPSGAVAVGIATELVPTGTGRDRAVEVATALAALPTSVYGVTKRAMLDR